jgi:hypothetical protein
LLYANAIKDPLGNTDWINLVEAVEAYRCAERSSRFRSFDFDKTTAKVIQAISKSRIMNCEFVSLTAFTELFRSIHDMIFPENPFRAPSLLWFPLTEGYDYGGYLPKMEQETKWDDAYHLWFDVTKFEVGKSFWYYQYTEDVLLVFERVKRGFQKYTFPNFTIGHYKANRRRWDGFWKIQAIFHRRYPRYTRNY